MSAYWSRLHFSEGQYTIKERKHTFASQQDWACPSPPWYILTQNTLSEPVLYSSVAPLKKRGSAASNIITKSSSSSVTPTSMYSFTRLYLACSRAHWLPTFLHRDDDVSAWFTSAVCLLIVPDKKNKKKKQKRSQWQQRVRRRKWWHRKSRGGIKGIKKKAWGELGLGEMRVWRGQKTGRKDVKKKKKLISGTCCHAQEVRYYRGNLTVWSCEVVFWQILVKQRAGRTFTPLLMCSELYSMFAGFSPPPP